ncbi:MAG: phosphotransferase [Dehalococcoidia bacterium]
MSESPLPLTSDEITVEWLNAALSESNAFKGATIRSFEREVIGEGVGFVGELSRITLRYDEPSGAAPRSLIAKLPTRDDTVRNIAQVFGFYEREVHFYEEMAEHVSVRTPKRYYSAMEPGSARFVLLIEDLAPGRCGDQIASCSLDEAKLALTELAKLQASWWNSPRFAEFTWLPAVDDPILRQVLAVLYQQSWPFFVEKFSGQLPDGIFDVGERFGATFVTLADGLGARPTTIVHTDFRLDNMFFELADGNPFALVDWQIVQRGLGAGDVTYFLAGNFPIEVRRAHEAELVRVYHDALLSHGVSDYDFDQCWEDYRLAALFMLIFLVTGREQVDLGAYNERAQTLIDTMMVRYTTAILDLNAAEFLPG